MKTRLFMALSALSLFLGASSACAELVRVTYAGIVGYGYDETGLFGSPETDLESESTKLLLYLMTTEDFTTEQVMDIQTFLVADLRWMEVFHLSPRRLRSMGTALQSKDVGELTWNDDGDTLGSGAYYAVLGTINDMDDFVTTNTGALTTTLNHNSTYTVLPTDQQGAYFNFNGVIAGIPLAFVNAHGEGDILV